jgi:PAS domain S-box-containing protein
MTEDTPETNAFQPEMAGTGARSLSEAAIENLRQRGGVFVGAVRATRMAMALTDPSLPGNPIVFANQSFLELSGYGLEEVLGQQPYFMNGPDTAPEDAARFRVALEEDRDEVLETVQYRKDGSRFVASLFLSAFKDEEGRTLHHFLSWGDVTARVDAASDAAALRAAQAVLKESEARLAAAFEVSPVGIGILDLDGRLILSNPEVKRFLPTDSIPSRDEQGQSRWLARDSNGERVDPSDWPSARALRGERAVPGLEMLYVDDDGSELWTRVASAPIRDSAGTISGAVVVVHDVTAFKKADERQRMLLAELQHRVRNVLAMIRSMVRRTAETSATVQDYSQHLEGRIGALARTQAMLTREPGRGVDLQSIVEGELLSIAAQARQYSCQGPPVTLAPKAAEVLSLAIHELATNAIKYGAFSGPGGRLEVSWSTRLRGSEMWLALHWIESGVADIGIPEREGFGMELITRRVPYELDGKGAVRVGADGISAVVELPLRGGPSLLETSAANDL